MQHLRPTNWALCTAEAQRQLCARVSAAHAPGRVGSTARSYLRTRASKWSRSIATLAPFDDMLVTAQKETEMVGGEVEGESWRGRLPVGGERFAQKTAALPEIPNLLGLANCPGRYDERSSCTDWPALSLSANLECLTCDILDVIVPVRGYPRYLGSARDNRREPRDDLLSASGRRTTSLGSDCWNEKLRPVVPGIVERESAVLLRKGASNSGRNSQVRSTVILIPTLAFASLHLANHLRYLTSQVPP